MLFKQIDWQLIKGYFKSYAICLVSLLSLYVVVDLFMHLDDFFHGNTKGLLVVVKRIGLYYAYRIPQLFDRLCEAIALLAAVFTVAMMQRNNEHLPMLAAGVPTQRIVAPILCCSFFMLGLSVANQELLIPRIASKLSLDKNDPGGDKEVAAKSAYEPNGIHLEAERGIRSKFTMRNFRCTIPESIDGNLIHLDAREARYTPSGEPQRGTWELIGCKPPDVDSIPGVLTRRDSGRYYLHTRAVDFDAMTRDQRWFQLASTRDLYTELHRPDSTRLAAIAVLFHTRLTRPIIGMVLVLMGLSVILRDTNRNVIISSGLCLVLCGLFFVACHTCKMLGDYEFIGPAMAAWLPVVFFGPFAVVMFDAVQT